MGGAHLVCVKWNKLQPSCAYKMRNLEVTRYVSLPPSPLLAGASGGHCLSVDGEEGVWVATAAALCRVTSDLAVQWSPCGNWSFQHCITQVSVEVPLVGGGHVTSEDYIIGVECVSESVCLATRNGDILLYNIQTSDVCTLEPLYEDTPSTTHACISTLPQVDNVGSVEGGLLGMAWSPDQELVVFSTGTGSLLLMTRQLDPSGDVDRQELVPVTEVQMCPAQFGQGVCVRVCG